MADTNETNFDRLRELVKVSLPDRLEAFDKAAHKLRSFHHDDDLLVFVEMAGFVALLVDKMPQNLAAERIALEESFDTRARALTSCIADAVAETQEIATGSHAVIETQSESWAEIRRATQTTEQLALRIARLKWSLMLIALGVAFVLGLAFGLLIK